MSFNVILWNTVVSSPTIRVRIYSIPIGHFSVFVNNTSDFHSIIFMPIEIEEMQSLF